MIDFNKDVIKASKNKIVIADFYAPWCGPCRFIAPKLESLTDSAGINLVKIDVDQNQDLSRRFKVMSVPTILAFKNGSIFSRYPLGGNPAGLSSWIAEVSK